MSSLLESSIEDIIDRYFLYFYHKENVNGVGLGNKFIKGINTGEPCLHVLVREKIPKNKLHKKDIIPKEFLGIKIDVIESGNINSLGSWSQVPVLVSDLEKRVRPIYPGCSISPINKRYSGTLGWIVFDNKNNKPHILSNNHILADYNQLRKGTAILQPRVSLGGNYSSNVVAKLTNFMEIKFAKSKYLTEQYFNMLPKNYADCAIAEILPGVDYEQSNNIIGTVSKTLLSRLNMKIRGVGRKSGYFSGDIVTIKANIIVDVDKNTVCIYKNQIMSNSKTQEGDSGALVVDFNNRAIGLLFGGNEFRAFITPIDTVLNLLDVHFKI